MKRALFTALAAILLAIPARADESDTWKLMLQKNYEELQYQVEYVDGVSKALPPLVKQTRQDLASLRRKVDELLALSQMTGNNPMELRAVLAGLDILRGQVDWIIQPFSRAEADIKSFQGRVGELEAEFARQSAEGASPEIVKAMGDFVGDLRKLKNKMGRLKTVLDQGLSPARDLDANLERSVKSVTNHIPRAWHDYFLSPGRGLLSVAAWQEAVERMTGLPELLGVYDALFDAETVNFREVALRLFGLTGGLLICFAVILTRLRRRWPWLTGIGRPLGALACMSLGISVLWVTAGAAFVLVHAEASALAEILFARGFLGVFWYLRCLELGEKAPKKDPVALSWGVFSMALLLQMPLLPNAFRGAAWVVVLLLAGWLGKRGTAAARKAVARADAAVGQETLHSDPDAAPAADSPQTPGAATARAGTAPAAADSPQTPGAATARAGTAPADSPQTPGATTARAGTAPAPALMGASGWLYPLLAVPVLFGWLNLSMLAGMAWFLLLVFFQGGLAAYGLINRFAARPSNDFVDDAIRALVSGLLLPLTVIAMAGGFLFWLSMSVGGKSVFWAVVNFDLGGGGFTLDLLRVSTILMGYHLAKAAVRVADRFIDELPSRRPDLERGIVNLLETCSRYIIWGLFALVALYLIGANFTSLAVVAGGLSVGIGFGMQNIINNFISGLILLFGRSIQAGDTLQIGEIWGVVQRVNIRNTLVQTFDNATLFVPNSDLIAQKILNWSHKDRRVRKVLEVGVPYGTDTAMVESVLLQAAGEHPKVLKNPKPGVVFAAFGDSLLKFKLLVWIDNVSNGPRTVSDVGLAVERMLKEKGVSKFVANG